MNEYRCLVFLNLDSVAGAIHMVKEATLPFVPHEGMVLQLGEWDDFSKYANCFDVSVTAEPHWNVPGEFVSFDTTSSGQPEIYEKLEYLQNTMAVAKEFGFRVWISTIPEIAEEVQVNRLGRIQRTT